MEPHPVPLSLELLLAVRDTVPVAERWWARHARCQGEGVALDVGVS